MSKKSFSKLVLIFTFILAVFVFVGCTEKPTLKFAKNVYEVEVGAEFDLAPEVANLENGVVKYAFSEEGIVEISGNKVTAKAEGAVTITATLEGYEDVKASIMVVVNAALVQEIEITGEGTVAVGGTVTLTAVCKPEYAGDKSVTWKSSNEGVAKVDANGVVEGVEAGEATIIAMAKDGSEVVAVFKIEVVNLDVNIQIKFDKEYVYPNESVNVSADVDFTGDKTLEWSVSEGATVENGVITFTKAGKYTVTAALKAFPEVKKSVTYTVYDKAKSISIDADDFLFEIGEKTTVYATVRPSSAKDEVIWSTSDSAIATVDENGVVTFVAGGLVKIIATAADGSGVKSELTVRVTPYVDTITITGNSEMDAYTSQTLSIVMGPEFCTTDYQIVSSNPGVATVSEKGEVNALAAGKTTITVIAKDAGKFSQTFEITVIVRANVVLCDPELASATAGETVEYAGVTYIVGQNAFGNLKDAIEATSNKVLVLAGEYGDINIEVDGIELVGPNAAAGKTRANEAVITGKVTIAAGVKDFGIYGFKFAGQSQVVGTAGAAGTASATKINLENFKFENNLVESELTAGKGFLYLPEGKNSYSKNTQIVNNTFKLVAGSALEAMVYVDNSDSLYLAGNKFENIAGNAFYQHDTTKGLCGAEPKLIDNEFVNIGKSAIYINWISPYNGTTGAINIDDNKFTNVGEYAVYIGSANQTDKYSVLSVSNNTFDGAKNYIYIERVAATYNVLVTGNAFLSEPTEKYIINGKKLTSVENMSIPAQYNTYYKDGALVFPDATKFSELVTFDPMYAPLVDIDGAADGTVIFTEGVVQYVDAKGYIIRDDLAGAYVYTANAEVKVGDRVQLIGKKGSYNGATQITDLTSTQVIESGCKIAAPIELTVEQFLALDASSKNVGLTVKVTGELVQSGNYINLKLNDSNTSYLTIAEADKAKFTALVGKKVAIKVVTYKKSGNYPFNCYALGDELAPALFVDAKLATEDAYNYKTVSAAVAAAEAGTVIYVAAGRYDETVTLDKSVSIVGPNASVNPNTANRKPEAYFCQDIVIKEGVSDVTLKGICFTAKGRVYAMEGGNKNLTVDYCVFDSQITNAYADLGSIVLSAALDKGNENLVVTNSRFESTGLRTISMYVEGVKDMTIKNNTFIGTPGSFADALKFNGDYPITGNVLIEANEFLDIAQYTIWFCGDGGILDANVDVIGNTFTGCGDYDAAYFRAVLTINVFQISEGFKSVVNFKQNILTDCYAALRVQHGTSYTLDQLEINVNQNVFNSWRAPKLIINNTSKDTEPKLVNADYNYFAGGVTADLVSGAYSFENAYATADLVPVYVDPNFVAPTELTITEKPETLPAYSEYQVLFQVGPNNASNQKVLFESSDIQVAQVSSSGLIKTCGEGTVTITARSAINEELLDTFTFTVIPVKRLEASYEGNGVIIGNESASIFVEIFNGADGETVTYTSSDPTIATVNENGVVTGVGEGVVEITITSTSGLTTKVAFTVIPEAKYNSYSDLMKLLINNNSGVVLNRDLQYIGSDDGSADYWHNIYGGANNYYATDLLEFKLNMLPADRPNNTNVQMTKVEFVVVHDTAGSGATSTAENNSNWCTSTGNSATSWHYTTGNDGIFKQLEDNIIAKHAGDGAGTSYTLEFFDTGIKANGYLPEITLGNDGYFYVAGQKSNVKYPEGAKSIVPEGLNCVIGENGNYFMPTTHLNGVGEVCIRGGNSNGIGIESAVNATSDVYLTWQITAKLVAHLLVKHDLLPDRMTYHNNFSGKTCPNTMMTAGLTDTFRELVFAEYEVAKNYSDYTIEFISGNQEILDNTGRVVKAPEYSTNVPYQVKVTKGDQVETITLNVYVPGQYNINTLK